MKGSIERVQASLLAGAMGESLGAEIEFWSLADLRSSYPNGLTDLPKHDGIVGAITDDTQMTLFTAEGLIRAWIRGRSKGIGTFTGPVHNALIRWLDTQGYAATVKPLGIVGLVEDARLRRRRAPGRTCLDSLSRASKFGEAAQNDSKGCGTIMRVAPIAFGLPDDKIRDGAISTSALTHGHPTGQLAAAAWAEILRAVWMGADVERTAIALENQYRSMDHGEETADALRSAFEAKRDAMPETVERLGGGWIAEEALAIALYSALATSDLESGLHCAVFHSGDSDSTGAIAGNLLGLLYPEQAFEHRWSEQIECRETILRLANDLIEVRYWSDEAIYENLARYPAG